MENTYVKIRDVTGKEHLQAQDGSTLKIYKKQSGEELVYIPGADGKGVATNIKTLTILNEGTKEASQTQTTPKPKTSDYVHPENTGALIGGLMHDAVSLYLGEEKKEDLESKGIDFGRIREIMLELLQIRRSFK